MIDYKNRVVKVIFYVLFSFLLVLSAFLVVMAYLQPTPSMGLPVEIMFLIFFLLLPSSLMIRLFTKPTPSKRRAGKMIRAGYWLPVSSSLVLSVLALALMSSLYGNRCERLTREAALWDCDFAGAELSNMDLQGSDMTRINLAAADLSGSNLSAVDLSGADLSGSDLSGANLTDAMLFNATLDGANLTGAILDGTNLKWASLIDVVGLTAESLANLAQWEGLQLQDETEMLAQLWQACRGMAVENAADYDPGRGATSIVLITDEGEKHPTNEYVPGFWWPASASNAELVACFSAPIRVSRQICAYDEGSSIERYSQRIEISVVVAQTGELLETITLEGPNPRACPEQVVAGAEQRDILGDAPYGTQIIEVLTPFASEGGDPDPPRFP